MDKKLYEDTLENGLKVFYIPNKTGKSFASLTTNFGSVDDNFIADGKLIDVPDGMAHFLEHKVFEQKTGNALASFGETGASPNAFTSNNITSYYFECTDEFDKNLEILLSFVYNPYFTDENVEKEKGIIDQEIAMIHDNPNWQVYTRLFQALYRTNSIRTSVAGTSESISVIDKEILYLSHKTFYDPSNMVLCVSGDIDFEKIINLARNITPKSIHKVIKQTPKDEQIEVYQKETTLSMDVSSPLFMIGFKDYDFKNNLEYSTIVAVALECLFGKSSSLSNRLYEGGLTSSMLDFGYSDSQHTGTILVGSESDNPMQVYDEILSEIKKTAKNGIDDKIFATCYKKVLGDNIRLLDEPSEICLKHTMAYFYGYKYNENIKIKKTDVEKFLGKFIDEKYSSISIINPIT